MCCLLCVACCVLCVVDCVLFAGCRYLLCGVCRLLFRGVCFVLFVPRALFLVYWYGSVFVGVRCPLCVIVCLIFDVFVCCRFLRVVTCML